MAVLLMLAIVVVGFMTTSAQDITDDLTVLSTQSDVGAMYGDTVVLTCTVISNSSTVNVTWNSTTSNILPEPVTVTNDDVQYNSSLTLTNVSLSHNGQYSCVANTMDEVDIATITLVVTVPPPEVVVDPSSVSVEYNEAVTLICSVTSVIEVGIIWNSTAGIPIIQPTVSTGNDIFTSTLVLSEVTLDHEGIYTCTANNTIGGGVDSAYNSSTVTVTVPPPEVVVDPSSVSVEYNETVTLICSVTSVIEVGIIWSSTAGIPIIQPTVSTGNGIFTSTLVLSEVTLDHEGIYTCTANNTIGGGVHSIYNSSTVTVTVPDPVVSVTPSTLNTPYNSSVTLVCEAVSFTNTSITWSTTASITLTDPILSYQGDAVYISTLNLDQVTTEHSGTYSCMVTNTQSTVNDITDLQVYVPLPEVSVVSSTNSFIAASLVMPTIECTIVSFTTPNVTWTVNDSLVTLQQPELRNGSIDGVYSSTLTVDRDILGSTDKSFTCTATNVNGSASDSYIIDVIVNPPVIQPIPNQTVPVTSNVTFFCNASSVINVTYQWSSDPYLTQCDNSVFNCILGLKEPVLTLLSVPDHFSTTLTCTVTDSDGQSSITTTILIVEGIRIISQSNALVTDPIIVIENGSVTLNCTFSHPADIPLPVDIFWSIYSKRQTNLSDNIEIVTSNRTEQSTVFVDTQLVIDPVMAFFTDKDPVYTFSNSYMCGAEPTGRFNDDITGEPVFTETKFTPILDIDTRTHPRNPTRINLGNTLQVDCNFVGNPVAEIFYEEVLSNGSVTILSPGKVQNGQVSYTINITEVSDQLYRCVGRNTIENIVRARVYEFRVIIQDRPQTIETINVTKLSFFTVRVEWNVPFNNFNNISVYHVNYTERLADDIDGLSTNFLSPISSTLIHNLGVNKMYDLIITSRNGVGESDPSKIESFTSITSSDASIINVQVPRILVTNDAFYIQWSYPSLLINPQVDETDEADVKHIIITVKTNKAANDMVSTIPYRPETTSTTITGFGPDTKLTITINIIYDKPDLLEGNEIKFDDRQTLPENNVPEEEPEVDMDALQGENPKLRLTWSPLSVEDGADFLVNYVVAITTMELPQAPVGRKRQAEQEESNTVEMTVDKSQTSFESSAEPYTMYTSQVFSQLNVNGEMMRRAITSPINVNSPESVPGSPPYGLQLVDLSFTSITLSWNLPSTPNGFITKYIVYQTDTNGVEYPTELTSVTTFTNSTLYGGILYRYRVTASTIVGEGPSATMNVTTPIGVYPPSTPAVSEGPGNTIIATIPKFSTLYGPLSHYQIIVVVGDSTFSSNDTTIYRYTDDKWRAQGYYVTAIIPANTDNMTFTVGDSTYTQLNSLNHYNAPLSEDTQYAVVIRLHSAADDSTVDYRDSGLSVRISFPSAPFNVAAVVIPIVIILLLLILIIVIVILVIIFLRKPPKHTETFYLDEIKATSMKPVNTSAAADVTTTPPRNGTSKSVSEGRVKATTPILAIQSVEVFTSVGQPTILLCEVSGSPAPEIIWSKDGRTLQGPQYRILADGSLYILDTDLKDDGNYVVSAYNDAGTVEEAVRVVVIAPLAPEPDAAHPPQTVSEFIERMALLHSTMDEQLEDEYHELELEWNITVYNAKLPVNHNKNRYVNIIPYDHSRVVLNIQDNASGSDYINASFIDGYNEANSYIATQGPIPSTFGEFWRMLWEYDIPTIVMVTNLKEDEKIKCHQYWPSYGATNYGDFQVTLKEVENIVDYGIRTFQIQPLQGGPSREIRQFHFQVWPDHGVPQYATALLGFRKRIKKYHPAGRGPVAVHCSAGVGRTGTFICIDTMMKMIEAEGKIDIFNFVRHMRFRRNYMVQTSTQYEFIHEALLETIMCGDTSLPVKSLTQRVLELSQVDPVTGKSGFLTQFQTLESSSPNDEEFDCSVAQIPDNLSKTRAHEHLPPNDSRVILSTKKYDSDYICASFIDGYRQRQCFITTQGPMKNTAGDFWRMVWEYNTSAIVMLTQLEEDGTDQCVQYWPSSGQEIWGSFIVAKSQEEDRVLPEYTVRKFNIHHIDNSDEVRSVSQFHYTNWSHVVCPSNGASLNDMIGEVLRVQRKSGNNPIVVHCSDGLGRTGTFCATFTILERVKAEQVVDVFSTVKSLRIQRPGLLASLDQYEFIHKVVVEFLTTFDNYNNFKLN